MTYDPLWLAITRAFHSSLPLTRDVARNLPFDDPSRAHALVTRELEWVRANVPERGLASVAGVQLFEPTAPAQEPGRPARKLSPNDQRACASCGSADFCSTAVHQSADRGVLRDAADREQGQPAQYLLSPIVLYTRCLHL